MNPKLLGIVNVTPDSFSDGGQFFDAEKALTHARKLMSEGATWVDIGAESTRPGATPVTPDEEWGRLKNVLPQLISQFAGRVSLDTRNPSTAAQFLEIGGTIINDVSGAKNPVMREIVAKYSAQVIVNHFPGKTINEVHEQQIDSIHQVVDDLIVRERDLVAAGVLPDNIILDPGIGFGKTMRLNRELLTFAATLPDKIVLIGHSKKRFLGDDRKTKEPNVEAAQVAVRAETAWLRVHDPVWYAKLLKS